MSEETAPAVQEEPKLYGTITPKGLTYNGRAPEYEDWARDLKMIWFMYEWSPWGLADCLAYGADHFPDRYEQAAKITGRAIKTIYNKTSLARQFPARDGLRSEKLSPGHHAVLAGKTDEEKRYYLKKGEERFKETGGHYGWRDFKDEVEAEEKEKLGAKTEKVKPPPKCGECFGSGKCPRCHGSGEEPL